MIPELELLSDHVARDHVLVANENPRSGFSGFQFCVEGRSFRDYVARDHIFVTNWDTRVPGDVGHARSREMVATLHTEFGGRYCHEAAIWTLFFTGDLRTAFFAELGVIIDFDSAFGAFHNPGVPYIGCCLMVESMFSKPQSAVVAKDSVILNGTFALRADPGSCSGGGIRG